MDNQSKQIKLSSKKIWPAIILLLVLGLAVHLLIPQITSLEHSWAVIEGMIWWAVILAFFAQFLSYLASGYVIHAIMLINHENLSSIKGALITAASASIGMVAGGWLGGAAATFTWIRKENSDGNSAALAGTLPSLLNNAALLGVTIIGVIYLMLVHDLTNLQMIDFGIISFILVMLIVGVIILLRYPGKVIRLAQWFSKYWTSLRKKTYEPEKIRASIQQIISAWVSLKNGKWLRPMIGSTVSLLFDMLTLYFMFVAAGQNIRLEILIAGYGLPLLFGKMAFLLPGGVGIVEGGMAALYTSLKIPNAVCVVVILGYRLLSFWIPSLLGFVAAAYLSRKQAQGNGNQVDEIEKSFN